VKKERESIAEESILRIWKIRAKKIAISKTNTQHRRSDKAMSTTAYSGITLTYWTHCANRFSMKLLNKMSFTRAQCILKQAREQFAQSSLFALIWHFVTDCVSENLQSLA